VKKTFLLLAIALITASLTACTSTRPSVCVTAYPIQYLVERIGGDRATICNLTEGDVIQRSQPVSDYKEKVGNAQLILTMGQLEPYWEIIRSDVRASKAQLIDLVSSSAVYKFKRFSKIAAGNSLVFIESPYYDGIAFEPIDTYEMDPVLWVDPIAMTSMASMIRDWFISYYPEDKRFFTENFEQLEGELVRLDSEFQLVKNLDLTIQFVSMTPSFGNWQKAYGVEVYPIMLSRYGVTPTSIQTELIIERIRADGIQYIAFEPNLTPELRKIYEYIKTELELTQVNLHNLTFLTAEEIESGKDYFDIMYENLTFLESVAEDNTELNPDVDAEVDADTE
jgi:zinc transport system substrate-binding protein